MRKQTHNTQLQNGNTMTLQDWQGVEDAPTYTMEWRNDPVIQGKYVNIYRDGELSAQAVAVSSDTNKVGIIYNVMLNGQWSKNEFEFTTLTEWVERFTK